MVRIFLDDIRNSNSLTVVRTAVEAIELVKTGQVEFISFDHDLGTELTGYDVAKAIEYLVATGKISCPRWSVHSANPVGRDNIAMAMKSAERFDVQN